MNHLKIKTFFLLFYLIWAVPHRSNASSLFQARRYLAQKGDKSNPNPIQETSPSPSPGPEVAKSKLGDDKVHTNSPKTEEVAGETCDLDFNKCHDGVNSVTACLLANVGDAPSGLFLLVHNDGESFVKLNVTILPANSTYNDADIRGHQVKKINISSIASGSSSIVVYTGNWSCKIERGVSVPAAFPSYGAYVKPMHGAYILVATALLIGVIWAFCKFGRDGRHLNGVPYQELEMGQQETGSSINVDSADGWDQGWDDEWDEEVAVKSPGGNHLGNRRANGDNSRSADSNERGNDWKD